MTVSMKKALSVSGSRVLHCPSEEEKLSLVRTWRGSKTKSNVGQFDGRHDYVLRFTRPGIANPRKTRRK